MNEADPNTVPSGITQVRMSTRLFSEEVAQADKDEAYRPGPEPAYVFSNGVKKQGGKGAAG